MDGLLRERARSLTGILNGADYGIWDPRRDGFIDANFSARMPVGKLACKRAVLDELDLDGDETTPLMAFVSRLVHQKMPDAVLEALPDLVAAGLRFALVAEGEAAYEAGFRELAERFPQRVAVKIGYQEPLAHRLLAGADMLAHPARYEPCGLVPIYAMRYGTLPIVRACGGMADTVTDATPKTVRNGTATGFAFDDPSAAGFLRAAQRAVDCYRQPITWRRIQAAAMTRDFGWTSSAAAYEQLYVSLYGTRPSNAAALVQEAV
jgi:starch synthase